ncbi:hypothetical protein BpHYR1_028654 [Brachionus plicatilis]|uniref:Uncharacterized protein n=1 Tax=Brachionus plicatilis TaxID=10195 RepID=A0A3M7RWQ4_BRAPC|nr:hypothetical protein BpHYR1_028654 [Brachionus plicatilis]
MRTVNEISIGGGQGMIITSFIFLISVNYEKNKKKQEKLNSFDLSYEIFYKRTQLNQTKLRESYTRRWDSDTHVSSLARCIPEVRNSIVKEKISKLAQKIYSGELNTNMS